MIFSFTKPGSAQARTPAASPQPQDWTNQELSDIYRAVACLGQAGILVNLDRGVTDEGDPWMVLCRLDGEEFIHFCRLDGRYLLDSPALQRPLRGTSFAELIDLFIAQAARAAAPNVVAFRASKVFLHPAALLTILVWSLYVWSSDATQAGELDEGDLGAGVSAHALLAAQQLADETDGAADAPIAGKAGVVVDGVPAEKLVSRLMQAMDQASGFAGGNSIAAMQMLAVMGTLVLTTMSTGAPDAQPDSAIATLDLLPEPESDARPDFVDFREALAQSSWDGSDAAAVLIAKAEQIIETALPAMVADEGHAIVAQAELALAAMDGEALARDAAGRVLSDAAPLSLAPAPVVDAPADAVQVQTAALAQEFAVLLSNPVSLAQYNVGGVSLMASFDPSALQGLQIAPGTTQGGLVDLVFDAPQLEEPPIATAAEGLYGEAARAFINSFLAQSDDIQIVASANELVLIDLTAFDDTMDRAYSYSWALDDGGIISTLGHFDFFASYALV